jgi:hypothetical protein
MLSIIQRNFLERAGSNRMSGWRAILTALIGALAGSAITASVFFYIGTKALQESTARELLSEVVAIVSLQEGWLLQGDASQTAKLSDNPGCKIADNTDPLRGIFAFKSDPF